MTQDTPTPETDTDPGEGVGVLRRVMRSGHSSTLSVMHIDDCTPLPFFEFAVTRWTFSNGHLELETHPDGSYLLGGTVEGKAWGDDDGEDFYFADSDALLDFLRKEGLLAALSAPDA